MLTLCCLKCWVFPVSKCQIQGEIRDTMGNWDPNMATGQLKEAPVSKGFFERYKKKSKKAKKGVKIEPKKEGDKQLKQLKFLVGKKD